MTYSINFYLYFRWSAEASSKIDASQFSNLKAEIMGTISVGLPILLGIYLQNKTLVQKFTVAENQEAQQLQVENIFEDQPDGIIILSDTSYGKDKNLNTSTATKATDNISF